MEYNTHRKNQGFQKTETSDIKYGKKLEKNKILFFGIFQPEMHHFIEL